MKHLNPTQLGVLRDLLLLRESQLAAEIAAVLALRQTHQDQGREVDAGVEDLETALGFAEAVRDQIELDAIHAALGRMDRGTFGRCLSCGVAIPIERLRVQPYAAFCHVCQARSETHAAHGPIAP
ncbi:MAG TPA: TraR/DksA family transcriptional regulator [Xanthomonadales bacterium]|nr:TraR/DksA family transcriptional regulator [Xanthomonadales bacterium]